MVGMLPMNDESDFSERFVCSRRRLIPLSGLQQLEIWWFLGHGLIVPLSYFFRVIVHRRRVTYRLNTSNCSRHYRYIRPFIDPPSDPLCRLTDSKRESFLACRTLFPSTFPA